MPGTYSTDLRECVLVAVEAGEPADAVAERFLVGRSSVYRWLTAARDESRRAPCLPFHAQCAWNLWQSRPRGWVAARSRSSATRPRRPCAACWRRTTT